MIEIHDTKIDANYCEQIMKLTKRQCKKTNKLEQHGNRAIQNKTKLLVTLQCTSMETMIIYIVERRQRWFKT